RQGLGLGVGETRQRNGRPVEMRFDEFRGFGDADVGVDVDRYTFRAQLAPRLAMAARGRALVFIPLLGHETMSLLMWGWTYDGPADSICLDIVPSLGIERPPPVRAQRMGNAMKLPARIIDLSSPLENETVYDPPFMRPKIE